MSGNANTSTASPPLLITLILVGGVASALALERTDPTLLLASAILMLAVLVALRSAHLAFTLAFGLSYLAAAAGGFSSRYLHGVPALVPYLLLATCFAVRGATQSDLRRSRPVWLAVVSWATVALASSVSAASGPLPDPTWISFTKHGALVILIVSMVRSGRELRLAIWGVLAVGGVLALLNLQAYLIGATEPSWAGLASIDTSSGYQRLAGPRGDPNFFGQLLLPLAPLAVDRFAAERRVWVRGLALLVLGGVAVATLLTLSRGNAAALIVGTGVVLFHYRRRASIWLLVLTIAAVLGLLAPSSFPQRLGGASRVLLDAANIRSEDSLRGRLEWLELAWVTFEANPVLGAGVGSLERRSTRPQRHGNLALEVAAETGFAGLAVFVGIGLGGLALHRRRERPGEVDAELRGLRAALSGSIVGYVSAGMLLQGASSLALWIWLALWLAVPRVQRRNC